MTVGRCDIGGTRPFRNRISQREERDKGVFGEDVENQPAASAAGHAIGICEQFLVSGDVQVDRAGIMSGGRILWHSRRANQQNPSGHSFFS